MSEASTGFVAAWIECLRRHGVPAKEFDPANISEAFRGGEWVLIEQAEPPLSMVLIPRGTDILKHADRLEEAGLSFSVLHTPSNDENEDPASLLEMLEDWGIIPQPHNT